MEGTNDGRTSQHARCFEGGILWVPPWSVRQEDRESSERAGIQQSP